MGKLSLSRVGNIFYGLAVIETGLHTIYYHDFPYWLIPPKHSGIPGIVIMAYIAGILFVVAGASILFEKKARQASLLLGGVLLMIFFFYHVPYQFIANPDYLNLLRWDTPGKELAFASGGFVIARYFSEKSSHPVFIYLDKLIPSGPIFFSITMITFGSLHCLYAEGVSSYVPTWVPNPVFWTYLAGAGLLSSGIAIMLKIKIRLAATLLGSMILTWFIILHIPRIIVSPVAYLGSELTSAFIALAYSGIAFAIAGHEKSLGAGH